MQISDLNKQNQDAKILLANTGELDISIDTLAASVQGLQRQLMHAKHKLDSLAATVEERKDRTLVVEKYEERLAMTEDGDELFATLADTAVDMQKLLADVSGKCQLLLLENTSG